MKTKMVNMIMNNKTLMVLILVVFILGLIVYATQRIRIETLQNRSKIGAKCPNLLVRRGNHLYLYNTTERNDSIPIHFNNLDEYIEFTNKQRAEGVDCPILFLQQENDVQGNDVYRVRPSPFDQQGGMQPLNENGEPITDASRDGEYNSNMFAGFDPQGQDIGTFNELDAIHLSTGNSNVSDNPMDVNWGGVEHTQGAVESGKYDKRQVTKPTYFTPSAQFFPGLGNRHPPNSFISSSGTAI
jgi:hypothetical protein